MTIDDFPVEAKETVAALTRQKKIQPFETKTAAIDRAMYHCRDTAVVKLLDRLDNLSDAEDIRVFTQNYLPKYLRLSTHMADTAAVLYGDRTSVIDLVRQLRTRILELDEVVRARL